MTKRNILAAVLAGLAMFLWGFVSHVVLGLGEVGMRDLPGEEKTLPVLRDNIKEPGFYYFPGEGGARTAATKEQREAATKAWEDKCKAGPWGFVIYHPEGSVPMSPAQLGIQFLTDLVLGLLLAFGLNKTAASFTCFGSRVAFAALFGLVASVAFLLPYWNWYGFPANFVLASLADQVIAFSLAGLVLAAMIKPPAPVAQSAAT